MGSNCGGGVESRCEDDLNGIVDEASPRFPPP